MYAVSAREPYTLRSWTRSGTPTPPAPASARPSSPVVTSSCDAFDVVLERVARGRPERSIVLTGLRGVGKTVLLNALRSAAVRADWGTGKLEARPDQSLRRPLASALHQARARARPPARATTSTTPSASIKAFAQREPAAVGARSGQAARPVEPRHRRSRPSPAGPTPATSRSTSSSCSPTSAAWPPTSASGSRCSSTRCRTSAPTTSRRCAPPATRSRSRGCR